MKKRILSILLTLAILAGALPATALADIPNRVSYNLIESFVYEGGIFDIGVRVSGPNAEKASFRWQTDASFGGTGSWSDLKDNSAWRGTKTDHLQLHTSKGVLYGTGWEDIPFRCLVTVNGKEYPTPDFFIQVMPKWMLVYDLEDAGEGFEKSNGVEISGYKQILSENENGFPSHVTAEAGAQLGFSINHTNPSAIPLSDFNRSEVSFVPEIKIYKNGSMVQSGSDNCFYTPTASGDTLTVEHNLYLKAGDVNHGIYQSNKMTVDVIAPESIGTASVKYDCSLLKERYTQSQKIIAIPKGREVQLIENSGSTWYKVMYYNTIGWLPADALNIQKSVSSSKQIDTVKVDIAEPFAEMPAPFTANVSGNGYTLHSIDWYDIADDRFLEKGETLKSDRIYTISIWLSSASGYGFAVDSNDIPAVKGMINRAVCDVQKAYEQDPHKVIELSANYAPLSHTCTPALVPEVAPSCQQAGHEAYYLCECGKAYRDAEATARIDTEQIGVLPIASHQPGDWSYNGTHHYRKCETCRSVIPGTTAEHNGNPCTTCGFVDHICRTELIRMVDPTCERDGFEKYYRCQQCGQTYKDAGATQFVNINSWGVIPKLPHSHGKWTYNTTDHASVCAYCQKTIPGTTAPHTGSICTVCGYVDPKSAKQITAIKINDVAMPVAGNQPDYTVSVGKGYIVDQNAQDHQYMHRGIAWYDMTDGKFVSLRHNFLPRHQYKVYIALKPSVGYGFGRVSTTVNGDDNVDFTGSNAKMLLEYTFPPCESNTKKITSMDVIGVAAPVAGNQPDYTVSTDEGFSVNIDANDYQYMHRGITWYDMTDDKFVSLRHTFLPRHQYKVYISLIPDEGYEFGRVSPTVNGDDDVDFAGSNTKMILEYVFPPCESNTEKITSITIDDVAKPVVGNQPDYTVSAGEGYIVDQNSKDYEYMNRGITWYDMTDDNFVSLRHTFIAGHQYKVYIALKPSDGYEFGRVSPTVNGDDDVDFAGSNTKMILEYVFPPCAARSSGGTRPYRG